MIGLFLPLSLIWPHLFRKQEFNPEVFFECRASLGNPHPASNEPVLFCPTVVSFSKCLDSCASQNNSKCNELSIASCGFSFNRIVVVESARIYTFDMTRSPTQLLEETHF